jgi:DNA-binding NarL/FixJ family response regulator
MKVGVAGTQVLIRKALCALLLTMPGVSVVLDIDSATDGVKILQHVYPDVLLVNTTDASKEINATSEIRRLLPALKLILLIDDGDDELELLAIKAGVLGCVPKTSDPQSLGRALKAVAGGERWISPGATTRIIKGFANGNALDKREAAKLTQREQEILALAAKGFRNKEIANSLLISENTVKTHLVATYRKLGVTSRIGAAMHHYVGAASH